jgi:membrane associated rhomboid family serine protease
MDHVLPPGVKLLLLANTAVFAVQILLPGAAQAWVTSHLGLVPPDVLRGQVWQLGTYLFLHGSFTHFLFNMFYLFVFGAGVERAMGKRDFLRYYFVTGIGAAVVWTLWNFGSHVPTVGASGAIYATMLAFGLFFPHSTLYLFFVIPVRAWLVVALAIGAAVMYQVSGSPDGVAHLIHLAGAAIGFVYLRRGLTTVPFLDRYRRWRIRRRLTVIDYRELMNLDDEDHDRGGRGSRP